ncbi:tubulin polyglutamylase TTLL11 isoform X1 [Brachionus plicatilis]|uniref:Tubulin polyglutamylase TTLL11 isoform X1 n=1 Tax=Brachionus plicatilis TaxID=10195 RepID=A0A3M7QW34_BRAPC|nr:tubulin polyglutamylase TTLL11 isoform X1 [Brachionus plicatilis]
MLHRGQLDIGSIIIGFDILLKEDLKPVLLEVNCNPSLRIDFESETLDGTIMTLASPIDVEIKKPLVLETLKLACPKKKLEMIEKMKKEEEQAEKAAMHRKNLVKQRIEQRSVSSMKFKKLNFDKIPLLSKPSQSYIKKLRSASSEPRTNSTDNSDISSLKSSKTTIKTSTYSSSLTSASYLRNIFPNNNLGSQYNRLYIQEGISDLFIFFTIHNTLKIMTHDDFRLFVRSCNIANRSVTSDNLDIIFFELSKKWDMYNTKKRVNELSQNAFTGLCYQGFVECFTKLSRMIFNESTLEQCVKSLVYYSKFFLPELLQGTNMELKNRSDKSLNALLRWKIEEVKENKIDIDNK